MENDLYPLEGHYRKFPVHFYEDGIMPLERMALRLRQIVASEYWQGHMEYTLGDIIRQVSTG